jgi:hypothetical protein
MKLFADRTLTGSWGTVHPGQLFQCPDNEAESLIARSLAHRADVPKILYETKVIVPREVGTTMPFRDMPLFDSESAGMASQGNPILSESDISEPGTSDNSGRRKRGRPIAGKRAGDSLCAH